jgi:hypothetical protein
MQSELLARNIISAAGWTVSGGAAFLDLDEGKSREIDISAHRTSPRRFQNTICVYNEFHFFAEVKKSERPWVVFKRYPHKWFDSCAWNNLTSKINLPCDPPRLVEYLKKHSLLKTNGWEGSGIHESFKNPDQPSRWYSAFVSVLKASAGYLDEYKTEGDERSDDIRKNPTEFRFVQPLVILDGNLVSAELNENNEIVIEQVESAAFRFQYKTKSYTEGTYRVDLVTLAGLPQYLETLTARQENFNEGLQNSVSFSFDAT